MHILCYRDTPVAAAQRWQRLCEHMTRYTPEQQIHMRITAIPILDEETPCKPG